MSTAFPNEPTGATNRFDHAFNNLTGLSDVYSSTEIVSDSSAPLSPSNVARHHLNPGAKSGGGELHAFLERGFEAFRSMRDASEFIDAIVDRERAVAVAIFSGKTLPG